MGLPGSSAMFLAAGTACQSPDWLATGIVALADGLVASRVRPRSLRSRTWPRSTVRVPVNPEVHQSVPASPSMAPDAGLADSEFVALACPDSAQSMVGAGWCQSAAVAGRAGPGSPAAIGSAITAGSAVAARRRRKAWPRPTAARSLRQVRRVIRGMLGEVGGELSMTVSVQADLRSRDRTKPDSTG